MCYKIITIKYCSQKQCFVTKEYTFAKEIDKGENRALNKHSIQMLSKAHFFHALYITSTEIIKWAIISPVNKISFKIVSTKLVAFKLYVVSLCLSKLENFKVTAGSIIFVRW